MGGAFIAVADDATAASWNPGGLIQLERPEISVVGAFFNRIEGNSFGTNPEATGDQSISESRINYFSVAYPFTCLGHNMIVSVNYQNLYDFTRDWNFPLNQDFGSLRVNQDIDYKQDGSLSAFAMAYCIQLTQKLSFGFTLNFWKDGLYDNEWDQSIHQQGSGIFRVNDRDFDFNYESRSRDKFSFSGFNANVGILWNVTEKFTVGTVFKTPFEADLRHHSRFYSTMEFPDLPAANSTTDTSSVTDEELDMPMSYGLGVAYRFSDSMTVSADIYRTEWQNFILKTSGENTSPISGQPENESDVHATNQVRVGAEYLFIKNNYVVPLRGGVFYDPAPAEGSPDDFYGVSLGSGIAYGRVVFDIAYQYRFGNGVAEYMLQSLDFSEDVDEHTVYTSVICHF